MYASTAAGGHALYTWELLTALAREFGDEFQYELVTSEDLHPQFDRRDYPIHRILPSLRRRKEYRSDAVWAISRFIHYFRSQRRFIDWLTQRPDVVAVHFQDWPVLTAPSLIDEIHRVGRKVISTVHNVLPHQWRRGVPRKIVVQHLRRARRKCDQLFVLTQGLQHELALMVGEPCPPICVAPHGIWTVDELESTPVSIVERQSWKRLLCLGVLRRNKGLDLLLDAIRGLSGFRLTIAGEPAEADFMNYVVRPKVASLLQSGVEVDLIDRFVPDEEVRRLMATHSVMVLPYTSGFVAQSGVAFLALAHRMPVVATLVGGMRDLFAEHAVGFPIAAPTAEAVRSAILRVFNSECAEQIQQGIDAAREHMTWRVAAERTVEAYHDALETQRLSDDWSSEPLAIS